MFAHKLPNSGRNACCGVKLLASNDEVTISDSAEKDVNMMLLADSVLASDSSENTEKGNLARLNMLRLATTAYGLTNTTYMPQALNTLPVKH